ncbi:Flagella basal body P-ring formation protein FlgA [uncultured delta proteobacterium]|uniref:Flagella basal body P-ring formation protein FlgA n=1 Tax=uncultured delta proteobacterium TaxID=34034 RepID=A0A212JLW0_9DELT|nr:Flagella basal body P-ring formation protein FlgA [uncultured delta proteobacterium]
MDQAMTDGMRRKRFRPAWGLLALAMACALVAALPAVGLGEGLYNGGWKLKIKEAAVVRGDTVTLGEIAQPIGTIDPALWQKLSAVELWPSPPAGKPMNMTRPKVQQAMAHYAQELSSLCSYPASMTIQQGGTVLDGDDLRNLVVKTLTPLIRNLPGEASLQDFRLPPSLFLPAGGQSVELEGPMDLVPGRLSVRIAVRDIDGSVVRRVTGTVFLDLWTEIPCAGVPLNKDEVLSPERVTFARKNLAHVKGVVWDGRGGPWRMQRPVPLGQPIMQADVAVIPTVVKGAPVTMMFIGKNFTLSVPGEALSDGAHGETIAVRNMQSKKQLRATVRDGQTVIVR